MEIYQEKSSLCLCLCSWMFSIFLAKPSRFLGYRVWTMCALLINIYFPFSQSIPYDKMSYLTKIFLCSQFLFPYPKTICYWGLNWLLFPFFAKNINDAFTFYSWLPSILFVTLEYVHYTLLCFNLF